MNKIYCRIETNMKFRDRILIGDDLQHFKGVMLVDKIFLLNTNFE